MEAQHRRGRKSVSFRSRRMLNANRVDHLSAFMIDFCRPTASSHAVLPSLGGTEAWRIPAIRLHEIHGALFSVSASSAC